MAKVTDLENQRSYWNREKVQFDSIYSHKKSSFSNWLDRTFRGDMYERFEYTMRNSEPVSGKTFLDVGCGTGRYAFEFVQRGCKHVTGIDISDEMVRHCTMFAEQHDMKNVTNFIHGDLLQTHLPDKVDISIGIGLFDYIKDPAPVLSRMKEYTNDRVIASFPRFWTWRAPIRKIRLSLRNCPVFFFSEKRLKSLLCAVGFTNFSIEKIGKLFCVTAYLKK